MLASVKIAILLELIAIFVPRGTRNFFCCMSYITVGVILVWNILYLVLINVNCSPYEGNWNTHATGRNCHFNIAQVGIVSAVANFVFDIVPLCLPQKVIWGLRISWRKKLGASVIFLIGILYVSIPGGTAYRT